MLNKSHPLYALDSNDKIIKLTDPNFRQVVRIVKEGESLHNVALKEIAYFLIMIKNMSESSTEILLKIYVKYSIDKTLMEGILSIHKSCAGAFIQDKIEDIVSKDKNARRLSKNLYHILEGQEDSYSHLALDLVLTKTLPYLSFEDKTSMLYLNKTLHRRIKPAVQESILSSADVTQALRKQIYTSIIPSRFLVK